MFGLDIIIARNNSPAVTYAAAVAEINSNAAALRAAALERDREHGSQPDANAEQLRRQNAGGWCNQCGSASGHYDFCSIINS